MTADWLRQEAIRDAAHVLWRHDGILRPNRGKKPEFYTVDAENLDALLGIVFEAVEPWIRNEAVTSVSPCTEYEQIGTVRYYCDRGDGHAGPHRNGLRRLRRTRDGGVA